MCYAVQGHNLNVSSLFWEDGAFLDLCTYTINIQTHYHDCCRGYIKTISPPDGNSVNLRGIPKRELSLSRYENLQEWHLMIRCALQQNHSNALPLAGYLPCEVIWRSCIVRKEGQSTATHVSECYKGKSER